MTGESITPEQLKTCAEALAQYRLDSEDKFVNGQFLDRGRTELRHAADIHATKQTFFASRSYKANDADFGQKQK